MKSNLVILVLVLLLTACAKEAPEPEFTPPQPYQEKQEFIGMLFANEDVFEANTTIHYALNKGSYIRLSLFDPDQGEIVVLYDKFQVAGEHTAELYGGFLPNGKYIVRLTARGEEAAFAIYKSPEKD